MAVVELEVIKQLWGGVHPARTLSLEQLIAGLESQVAARRVRRVSDGHLQLFNYTQEAMFSNSWDVFSLIARGLILDVERKQLVARGRPEPR